jgi:histidinol dehydrogenase
VSDLRTGPMRVVRWEALDEDGHARLIERAAGMRMFDPELREGIAEIVEDVRERGDAAVLDALERFDGCTVEPGGLRVSEDELAAAGAFIDDGVRAAIRDAIDHCRRFNERVLENADWRLELEPGLMVGEQSSPISSAGLFVPSGKGSYPSVLVQLGSPAVVAGVPDVAVVVPPLPGSGGAVDPAVLVAAEELGLHTVLRANGPAGVAALAFGTESFPKVRKIVGPGSPPVACAQLEVQRYGCATQVLLGPSESLILADSSADPILLAADLLNEAEHGLDSASVLVTDDEDLVEAAQEHLALQLAQLPEPRRSYAAQALGVNGGAILVSDISQGIEVTNAYAPEHMQLVVRDEEAALAALRHAGEILLGQWTPISAANYVIGVPAALPTGRFARVTSGITAETFRKKTSIAKAGKQALTRLAPTVLALADHEGFPAHAAAVRARLDGAHRPTQGGRS